MPVAATIVPVFSAGTHRHYTSRWATTVCSRNTPNTRVLVRTRRIPDETLCSALLAQSVEKHVSDKLLLCRPAHRVGCFGVCFSYVLISDNMKEVRMSFNVDHS